MSMYYYIELIYGIAYSREDDFSLAKLNTVYGDEDQDPEDILSEEISSSLSHSYPFLSSTVNYDDSDSSNNTLIVYAKNLRIPLFSENYAPQENYPIIIPDLKLPNRNELNDLERFVEKFPSLKPTG